MRSILIAAGVTLISLNLFAQSDRGTITGTGRRSSGRQGLLETRLTTTITASSAGLWKMSLSAGSSVSLEKR